MSQLFQKFMVLPRQEKLWSIAALVLTCILRIGLKFTLLNRCLFLIGIEKATSGVLPPVNPRDLNLAHRIGQTVASVAASAPWDSPCLVQALCSASMLRYYRIPYTLQIGTHRTGDAFNAHAWIIVGNEPVVGGEGMDAFTLLAEFGPAT